MDDNKCYGGEEHDFEKHQCDCMYCEIDRLECTKCGGEK